MLFNRFKLFFISIVSMFIIVVYIEPDYNNTIVALEKFISSDILVFISCKVFLMSVWFLIGIYSYINLIPRGIILRINKLSLLELFIILSTLFISLMLIETFFYEYIAQLNDSSNYYNCLASYHPSGEGSNSSSSSSNSNNMSKASDGAIMTAAMAGGMKFAPPEGGPTVVGKTAAVVGAIGAGAGAIMAKNIAGNINIDIVGTHFISNNNLIAILRDIFHLTGNNAIDLLCIIQYFHRLQFIFITLIIYNILLTKINEDKLEGFLGKFLPSIFVRWYIRSLIFFKKTSLIVLVCLLILLLISNYYSYHYLQFFIENVDKIVNFYFNK